MSYEMCNRITLKPKTNQIFLNTTSNNVYPKTYSLWEYIKGNKYSLEDKLFYLMEDMLDGNIQISQKNKNTIPYKYALIKIREYYRENDIDHFDDRYEQKYIIARNRILTKLGLSEFNGDSYEFSKEREEDYKKYNEWQKEHKEEHEKVIDEVKKELYKEEFNIFKNALKEKVEGKFFFTDRCGNIIEFLKETKYGYRYYPRNEISDSCLMDYKTAVVRKDIIGSDISIRNVEHPLVSKYLEEKISKYPLNSQSSDLENAKVFMIYYDSISDEKWYVIEGDKQEDDYIMYGYIGNNERAELSYFYLSDLEKANIKEMPITKEKTLLELLNASKLPIPNEMKTEELEVG